MTLDYIVIKLPIKSENLDKHVRKCPDKVTLYWDKKEFNDNEKK